MKSAEEFYKYKLHLKDAKAVHLCYKVGGFEELWKNFLTSYGFDHMKSGDSLEGVLVVYFGLREGVEVCFVANNIRKYVVDSLPCCLDIFWLDWIINHHIRIYKNE